MFALIAAADKNMGIGVSGKLPWNLPSDLKYYRETTLGKGNNVVIMGRTTWESIPKSRRPLPDRVNIVLTRNKGYEVPHGVRTAPSLDEALTTASRYAPEKIFVIGGAQIFAEAINHSACGEIYLTQIFAEFNCDTFFPKIEPEIFKKTWESEMHEENGTKFQFQRYSREGNARI